MTTDGTLADHLYEAALVPELWTDTCERLAAEIGSSTASIFTVDGHGTHRYVTSRNIAEAFRQFANSKLRLTNIRAQRALERSPFAFGRDIDILTKEEYEQDPIRPAFLHPHGMEWEAGCVFQEPTGHMIAIILMQAKGRGHFSDEQLARLNALKPDLARAAYMSSRLAFNEARSMTEALSMLGLPAAVIGDSGQAIAMNPEMESLSPRIRTGAGNRLVFESGGASALFNEALERYRARAVPTVQSLPMVPRNGAPALILHLLPVRRAARDIFSRSMAVLAVTEVGKVGAPDMRVLSGLFDLTPAEARVARGIALGQTTETIAASLGISLETARSHLKRIMQKTGTTRQAELVLLLSGLSAPGSINGSGDTA
ncbi:helix-turn-helix transcriptional regulator [Neorhizobium sp. S3-V5DH]|jgi:DNA-binding CsgD family transcriptional regulator|uniref:helix-turn-helix transcriptional regulator n=1 Tax=Neorhizobium sp. S3-V5DH TaxID=2485166 RepID=UPI0010458565|nr:helix-turn-helix transcriptional regulator [Neorhizobium sp. S3-V5DH]TCV71469.1 DNA-binding CsgD family transcriptional regulator [Neorhizobium sp. S3-V5DH]